MRREHTAFYLSTLLLLLLFVGVLAVLTGVFSQAQRKSAEARELTAATALARNAAEALSAAHDETELAHILRQNDNIRQEEGGICASYDQAQQPSAEGFYRVHLTYEPQSTPGGTLVRSTITVETEKGTQPLCSLSTAVYIRGGQEP